MKYPLAAALLLGFLSRTAFAQDVESKPVLSVLDFTASAISGSEARIYADVLSTYIVHTGAYRVIDREQRDAILTEIEFSYAGCADERCQLEIGRLLAASQLVVGSIGRIGGWLIVSARLLEVATGETLRSTSQKYPSLEALIDEAPKLVEATLGRAVRSGARSPASPGAQAMISSVKQEELKKKITRLRRRVGAEDYSLWLRANRFADYEQGAVIEEKIAFLEEYLHQANSRGHAFDLAVSYSFYQLQEPLVYRYSEGQIFGITASWSFQFNSRFSTGINLYFGYLSGLDQGADSSIYRQETFDLWGGPLFIFGDKVDSFALLLALGIGGWQNDIIFPIRCGLYYRNLYLGYVGQYWAVTYGRLVHGAEAGYSLFLGRRRSWRPSSARR